MSSSTTTPPAEHPNGALTKPFGRGGRIYHDSRVQDQTRATRVDDIPPWADQPEYEDDGGRPAPEPLTETAEQPAETAPEQPAPRPDEPRPDPRKPNVVSVVGEKPAPTWDRREFASTAIELVGIAALAGGCFLVRVWLGLMITGICLIILGVLTSRRFDG